MSNDEKICVISGCMLTLSLFLNVLLGSFGTYCFFSGYKNLMFIPFFGVMIMSINCYCSYKVVRMAMENRRIEKL